MARLVVLLSVLGILCAACGNDSSAEQRVRVFAASSLTDVLPEIVKPFERGGASVELIFGGSSALREQVLDGADVDVFISANQSVMDDLVDAARVEGDPVVVARNSMTIVVPLDNPGDVDSLSDLADERLTIGLCAIGVPCGDLASDLLAKANLEASVDTFEQNVRSLLAKVELGELDAALVYRTDAMASEEVLEIAVATDLAPRSVYLAAVLDGGENAQPSAPEQFASFLRSPIAERLLVEAGFETP